MRDVLSGTIPMLPKVKVPFVDVRDVAAGHVAALTKGVPGQRYLLVGETIWLNDVGPKILAPVYKPKGFKVTEGTAPGFIVWLLSFLDRCERGAACACACAWSLGPCAAPPPPAEPPSRALPPGSTLSEGAATLRIDFTMSAKKAETDLGIKFRSARRPRPRSAPRVRRRRTVTLCDNV